MGIILVTGASRGIGRGIALELASAGHTVAVHYNGNRDAALETVSACSGDGHAIFQANIGEAADRERLVEEVFAHFGRLDGLVNNAGIAPRRRDDIVYAHADVFDEVIDVNLKGPYFLTQLVAQRWLADAGQPQEKNASGGSQPDLITGPAIRGRIVFVTSVSAVMVSTARGEYCVSKAGLAMASELFAARLAPEGIVVCEVRPGIVKTDMTAGVTDKYDRLIGDGLVPQARWGNPRDTGKAVRAVMDGQLDFSSGSVIYTDGALHLSQL
jgi:NAD(P)-dependent dehydrogenase (short-subunit alcohol dehydrogenase family)